MRLTWDGGLCEVYPDAWLRPHDRFWVAHRLYVGLALWLEMCGSERWPRWARDVFWAVT